MNYLSNEDASFINHDIILTTAASPSSRNGEQQRRMGSGMIGTIFLIVNATLGAGLLNFPQAFDKSGGVATAIIAQVGFLIVITAALVILAKCSDVTHTSTMQEMFATLCGRKSLFFCGLCVILYSFGCCLTFLIIIGDQFDRVFVTYYGLDYCHTWYLTRTFVTCMTAIVFILPLCFFKRLDVLSFASSIGCVTILYVIWLIVYESYSDKNLPSKPMNMWPDDLTEILQIVPVICFAYQSHMTAIPTYACMQDRKLWKFAICAIISMILCFLAYSVVGIYGYKTFGIGSVPSDILQGYSDKSTYLTLAIISVALKNCTAYPIILYCGRDSIMSLLGRNLETDTKIRLSITVAWFALSLAFATIVPDISPVINLMGSLSAAFIFLFPGICLLQNVLQKDPRLFLNKDRFLVVVAIFITALGAFVCGVVFVEAVQDLTREPTEPPLVTGYRAGLGASLCT